MSFNLSRLNIHTTSLSVFRRTKTWVVYNCAGGYENYHRRLYRSVLGNRFLPSQRFCCSFSTRAFVLANVSVQTPRKLFNFIIQINNRRIKYPKSVLSSCETKSFSVSVAFSGQRVADASIGPVILCSKVNRIFSGYFDPVNMVFFTIRITDVRGDLTDVSANQGWNNRYFGWKSFTAVHTSPVSFA